MLYFVENSRIKGQEKGSNVGQGPARLNSAETERKTGT